MTPTSVLFVAISVGFAIFSAYQAYRAYQTYKRLKDRTGPCPPHHINCRCTLGDHE